MRVMYSFRAYSHSIISQRRWVELLAVYQIINRAKKEKNSSPKETLTLKVALTLPHASSGLLFNFHWNNIRLIYPTTPCHPFSRNALATQMPLIINGSLILFCPPGCSLHCKRYFVTERSIDQVFDAVILDCNWMVDRQKVGAEGGGPTANFSLAPTLHSCERWRPNTKMCTRTAEIHLHWRLSSMVDFVSCDRLMQNAHYSRAGGLKEVHLWYT